MATATLATTAVLAGSCTNGGSEFEYCDADYVPSMEVIEGEKEEALAVFADIGDAALKGVFDYVPPEQYQGDPIASTHKQLLSFLVRESSSDSLFTRITDDGNKIDSVSEVFCTIDPELIDELNEKRALRPIEDNSSTNSTMSREVPEFYNTDTLYLNNRAFTILDIVATQIPIINSRNAITPPQEEEDIQPPITYSLDPVEIFEHMRFVTTEE